MTTTWANVSKDSSTFSNLPSRSGSPVAPGFPIGLLLVLTYAFYQDTSWTNGTLDTSVFTNQSKN